MLSSQELSMNADRCLLSWLLLSLSSSLVHFPCVHINITAASAEIAYQTEALHTPLPDDLSTHCLPDHCPCCSTIDEGRNPFSLQSAQTPQCASHIYLHSLQGSIKVAVGRILSSFLIASSGWHKGMVLFVSLFSSHILSILKKLGYHCYHIPKSRSYAYAPLQGLSLCQL